MTGPVSAQKLGMISCLHCETVYRAHRATAYCPRCGAKLSSRKPDSLARTAAFLLAGAFLYVPANLLPVMETTSVTGVSRDTIMGGIVYFWTSGSPGLAVLIFTVSILVPVLKLAGLSFLAFSVASRSQRRYPQRARLFRLVELVGRWSMLDIFVVALMVGLVRFQNLATIEAGPGAAAFGAVVVLTMLAARSFDPRLMWDHLEVDND